MVCGEAALAERCSLNAVSRGSDTSPKFLREGGLGKKLGKLIREVDAGLPFVARQVNQLGAVGGGEQRWQLNLSSQGLPLTVLEVVDRQIIRLHVHARIGDHQPPFVVAGPEGV